MTFGEKLQALMAERGLSLRALARMTHYNPGYLSQISHGLRTPSLDAARNLDQALQAHGELAALRRPRRPRTDHAETTASWDAGGLTPDDDERLVLTLHRPSRLDSKVVADLRAVLAAQRRLEDSIGPNALLVPTTAQLATLTALQCEASGPHRDDLARVVSEWTCFAGWLHAALRHDRRALELFDLAERLADDVADGTLAATATSFRGYVARRQGRHRAVIRAASAALATPGAHPAQRTFDTLQAAQGHAAAGDTDQARRLLDRAADLANNAADPPPAVYWYSEPFFRLNIGIVHLGIGEHRDAADLISTGLRDMPPDQQHADWTTEYRDALTQAAQRA